MGETLNGMNILVTRPPALANTLCDMIESYGGNAIRLPMIAVEPPENPARLRQSLAGLGHYHIGIFVSKNAVSWTLDLLEGRPEPLISLQLVAIGESTAELLGRHITGRVICARGKADSEALLNLDELQSSQIQGKNIVIFRGADGREVLARELRARGANVDYMEVYRRVCPQYDPETVDDIWTSRKPDVIVITSSESLKNLFGMLSSEQQEQLLDTQLVVMGKRIADQAVLLGFSKTPVVVNKTDDEGIVDAIMKLAGDDS